MDGNNRRGDDEKHEDAIRYIDGMLADESGYDEAVWQGLKGGSNRDRARDGERLPFPEPPAGKGADETKRLRSGNEPITGAV